MYTKYINISIIKYDTHIFMIILYVNIILSSCGENTEFLESYTISSFHPSLLIGHLDFIQNPHWCNSLLVGQHWCVHLVVVLRRTSFASFYFYILISAPDILSSSDALWERRQVVLQLLFHQLVFLVPSSFFSTSFL